MIYNPAPKHSYDSPQSDRTSTFRAAGPDDRRAPCPALNTLANHGYLPRSGTEIPFPLVIHAIQKVYNLSLPLTLLLSVPAYLIYGKLRAPAPFPWTWSYTIDLDSLSVIGSTKIAHYASLVHPNHPSHAPDPEMLHDILSQGQDRTRGQKSNGPVVKGLTLIDVATIRVERELKLLPPHQLSSLHKEIALGESALTLLILADRRDSSAEEEFIPMNRIAQWFGEERLPDGWWGCDGQRPYHPIRLMDAKRKAQEINRVMKSICKKQMFV